MYKPIANKDKKQIENILKASEKFFRVIAIIFVVYLVALSIVYPTIVSSQFAYMYTLSLVLIISISTLAEYFFGMTYTLYLQAEQKTYITSIVQMVGYILNTIAILVLVKCNASIQIVKLVSSMIFVFRPIVQNIYVKKKYSINLKEADKNYQLKQKWDGLAQHIAFVIHSNTDIALLTFFSSMAEISVYSVYYLVIKGIKSFTQAFISGISDSFGDMIAKNEKKNLNINFKIYELFFSTIITTIYSATLNLIVPFVMVYTLNIHDANYIRPEFAMLLVIGEFTWAIRQPYNELIKSAGHFKQTKKGAWVEAISNIIISLIFVWKYGIVGVAIGTLVAMLIRTVEFVYHTNKYILERKQKDSLIRFGIIAVQVIAVALLSKLLPTYEFTSYFVWIKYACMVFALTVVIVLPINLIVYKDDTKNLIGIVKRIVNRKRDTNGSSKKD